MKDIDEIFNELKKNEMLQREIDELVEVLKIYADKTNWHNSFAMCDNNGECFSPSGEGPMVVWNRLEDGWELAQRVLGDF